LDINRGTPNADNERWSISPPLLLAATLATGCKQNGSVTQAEKADKVKGVAVPSIEETKQICGLLAVDLNERD